MKAISISAAFLAIFLISCQKTSAPDPDQKPFVKKDSAELVQYGKYLVTITGCNDCHTPKKMGPKGPELIEELLLSGFQGKNAIPEFDKEKTRKVLPR